jgi:hypothetical protein
MSEPLITTIIPTYRRPRMLKKAIQSVLNQTCPFFQVMVYDNGSGDETKEIVAEFSQKDSRVHYHCHASNIGAVKNFQYGLCKVNTPFFSFLADDDLLFPEFYEKALEHLKKFPQAAFFLGSTFEINEGSGKVISIPALKWPDQEYFEPSEGLLHLIPKYVNWTSALFNRKILDEKVTLDPAIKAIDVDFVLHAAAKHPFVFSKHPCAIFFHHPTSYSGNCGLKLVWPGWLHMAQKLKKEAIGPLQQKIEELMQKSLRQHLLRIGIALISKKRFTEAHQVLEIYTGSVSKIGIWQGGALNLKQAKLAPKQLMCKHMGDAGGFKVSGCPTQPEPIFESRAVYKQNGFEGKGMYIILKIVEHSSVAHQIVMQALSLYRLFRRRSLQKPWSGFL